MKQTRKILWLKGIGYALCIIPPLLATLEHFPLWLSQGKSASFSVISLCLLLFCLLPLRKGIRKWLRSPSAWQIWTILWIVLTFTKPITEGILAIAAVACPTSLLGAILFWRAKKLEKEG